MFKSFRVWLAPVLTIALLVAHGAVQRQANYAAAEMAPQTERQLVPALSILEAADLLGHTVTLQGKVASEPQTDAEGRISVRLEDETGSLQIHTSGQALRVGDVIRVTGTIGGSGEAAILKADNAGIERIR